MFILADFTEASLVKAESVMSKLSEERKKYSEFLRERCPGAGGEFAYKEFWSLVVWIVQCKLYLKLQSDPVAVENLGKALRKGMPGYSAG